MEELCACRNGLKLASGVFITAITAQGLLLGAMALVTVLFSGG